MDNVPAKEVRKLGADKVITLKFSSDLEYEPKNIYDVILKSVDILFDARSQEAIHESDYVIDLKLPDARVFDTKKVDYCYEIGYMTAITNLIEIKDMLKK